MMMMFLAMRNLYDTLVQVDALDVTVKNADAFQQFSDGAHDMGDVEIARRDLVQHRRKEEEIFAIDECNLDVRIFRQSFFKIECRIKSAKAAAEYQYPFLFHSLVNCGVDELYSQWFRSEINGINRGFLPIDVMYRKIFLIRKGLELQDDKAQDHYRTLHDSISCRLSGYVRHRSATS